MYTYKLILLYEILQKLVLNIHMLSQKAEYKAYYIYKSWLLVIDTVMSVIVLFIKIQRE